MAATKTDYKYVGLNAHTLNNGRPVEPGEAVKLTSEEVKENESMIEEGTLIKLEAGKEV